MAVKTNIGDHLRLWRGDNFSSGVCIVSAHGGQTSTTDTFTSTLHIGFYQTRNEVLLATLNTGLSNPNENVPPGTACEDYTLTKFQGSHGDNSESYDDIKSFVDQNDAAVLTVRNRTSWFVSNKGGIRFSAAVKLLEQGNYGISHINALFCRVPTRYEAIPSPFLQAQGIRDVIY